MLLLLKKGICRAGKSKFAWVLLVVVNPALINTGSHDASRRIATKEQILTLIFEEWVASILCLSSWMVLLTMISVNSSNSIGHIDLWSKDVALYAGFNWCCLTLWCDIPCLFLAIWYEWHFGILKGRLWIYLWVAPSSSHLECRFQQFTWSQPLGRGTTPHHSQCECTEEPQDWGSLGAAPQPVGWLILLNCMLNL